MQINPKYRNNPAFNKALSAHSEVTSAKKMGALGTSTISCSNLDFKKEKNSAEEAYCKKSERNKVISKFEEYIDENYFSANAQIISKKGGYTCYAANENSLVITPDLYVRKCTVAIDDPINIVGRISDNGDFIKNNNFSQWIKDYSDQYCNSCSL